ncbi:hypothetical protein KP509_35G065600 [Ceratopteris richardii]|nr:hypothetical protein KP509_35G065600 [Ceratopteris richardii]
MSPSNPFEAVSFNEFNLNHHRWKTVAAFRGGMRTPVNSSIVEIPFRKDSKCGVKHSTNPLIGIMEAASCEEGDTSASRDDKPDRKEFTPYFRSTQARKRSISSPEYICNSHSDYYGSGRAQSVRTTRTRKKSGKDACQGSMEKDSARMRRRAQSQTKWRLRGQRVDRHSWLRSGPEDVINIKPYPNEDDEVSSEMRISREQHPESSVLASAIYVHSELENHRGDEGVSNQHSDGDAQSSFDEKSRLTDSVPVVKQSRDPLVDFRDSMMDMVIERQIYTVEDLSELLRCFLTLNPSEHHDTIVRAFTQVWGSIFGAD